MTLPHTASDFQPVQKPCPEEPGWDANGAPTTEDPETHAPRASEKSVAG